MHIILIPKVPARWWFPSCLILQNSLLPGCSFVWHFRVHPTSLHAGNPGGPHNPRADHACPHSILHKLLHLSQLHGFYLVLLVPLLWCPVAITTARDGKQWLSVERYPSRMQVFFFVAEKHQQLLKENLKYFFGTLRFFLNFFEQCYVHIWGFSRFPWTFFAVGGGGGIRAVHRSYMNYFFTKVPNFLMRILGLKLFQFFIQKITLEWLASIKRVPTKTSTFPPNATQASPSGEETTFAEDVQSLDHSYRHRKAGTRKGECPRDNRHHHPPKDWFQFETAHSFAANKRWKATGKISVGGGGCRWSPSRAALHSWLLTTTAANPVGALSPLPTV